MEEKEFIYEVESKNSKIEEIDENLHEVCKSICKISYYNEKSGQMNIATGFFIQLYKDGKELFCLMTNHHVIEKEIIESKVIINIKYKYEKKLKQIKLDEKERYIKYNKEMDFTIVEIKPEDKIKDKYFLIPNLNNNNFSKENIVIIQFPLGKNLSKSEGKIKRIDNYQLIYDASTKRGSSGSPIFLKGTTEVIGIHKGGYERTKENYGTKIYSIIESINIKEKEDKKKNEVIDINAIDFYNNDGYYLGEILNYKKHGKGIIFDMDGNVIYEGDFVDDYYEGNGKLVYENGDYYIGQFLKGEKHGKGKEYRKNGDIKYEGDFVNGKAEGMGNHYNINGDYYYVGQWLNGSINGKGIIYDKNGNMLYDGDFVNGKREGNGTLYYEDGEYIGQFVNNKMQGKGIEITKDSETKYEGEFVNNLCEGYGTLYYLDGCYYTGYFVKGLKHGKGILHKKDGKIFYDGDFVNDEIEGNGKINLENGEYYIGQFFNSLKHGKGIIFYNDGSIKYEGDFFLDKVQGKGKFFDKNGEYFIGQWLNGLKHGKGTHYYKNGQIKFEADYINDKIEGNIKYIDENNKYYLGQYLNGRFKGIIYDKNGKITFNNKNDINGQELEGKKCIIF